MYAQFLVYSSSKARCSLHFVSHVLYPSPKLTSHATAPSTQRHQVQRSTTTPAFGEDPMPMAPPREFPSASGMMDCAARSTHCDGQIKPDAQLACTSWCKVAYQSAHCAQCKCKECAFCESRNPAWLDSGSAQQTASQPLVGSQFLDLLQDRWLVLIGDSSVRMQFHFLLGMFTQGWQRWPDDLESRGPDNPAWRNVLTSPPCLTSHSSHCMEDARIGRVRLTCLWSEFGEVAQLTALQKLANENAERVPDGLFVGVGAWWVEFRKAEHAQYVQSVQALVAHLDTVYADQRVVKIFGATTSCGKAPRNDMGEEDQGEEDGTSLVVHRFNGMAKRQVLSAAGWSWFARDVVTGEVCDAEHDCAGQQYNARFHPAGAALNILTRMLLERLAQEWAASGPAIRTPSASAAVVAPQVLPTADLRCYAARYSDMFEAYCESTVDQCQWTGLAEHWERAGRGEGRMFECVSDRPGIDLRCYALRYPDLLQGFCNSDVDQCDWNPLMQHWEETGTAEGRHFGCDEFSSPSS